MNIYRTQDTLRTIIGHRMHKTYRKIIGHTEDILGTIMGHTQDTQRPHRGQLDTRGHA